MQKPQFFFQKLPDAIKMTRIQLSSAISKKYKIIFFFFVMNTIPTIRYNDILVIL